LNGEQALQQRTYPSTENSPFNRKQAIQAHTGVQANTGAKGRGGSFSLMYVGSGVRCLHINSFSPSFAPNLFSGWRTTPRSARCTRRNQMQDVHDETKCRMYTTKRNAGCTRQNQMQDVHDKIKCRMYATEPNAGCTRRNQMQDVHDETKCRMYTTKPIAGCTR